VNKNWKKGGDRNKPLLKKLESLYEQGGDGKKTKIIVDVSQNEFCPA